MTIFDPTAPGATELLQKLDDFVATSPYGVMMQSPAWAKVKSNWDSDYIYRTNEGGEITAVLSIISVKQPDGTVFMYAPRGPVCDIYDVDLVQDLLTEAETVVKNRGGFLLRLDPEAAYDSTLVEQYRSRGYTVRSKEISDPKAFSNPRMNMILDLTGKTEEDVLSGFSSRFRGKIRKSYKSGLTTRRFGVKDEEFRAQMDSFFNLTKIMAERQGISHRPESYFLTLMEAFSNTQLLMTFDETGEALSGCILVSYNRKCFYIYAASSNEKRNLYPAVQTNFEGIKYALEMGNTEYDMGGVFEISAENGLYRFKKEICGEEGLLELLGEIDVVFDTEAYAKHVH
ncbi:lipid II:glycine glycyltransferase FemX [Gleimia coleocanis]|nr:peptidoglycan bridge formation glycyltransferase FemA/FemB family protein [Gleimia coleocanis]